MMDVEQENRILANQALIMEALMVLLSGVHSGGEAMRGRLMLRLADIEQFKSEIVDG